MNVQRLPRQPEVCLPTALEAGSPRSQSGGWVSGVDSPPHGVLTWWREPWSPFPLCQDLGPTDLRPTLRTTFNLCASLQAPSPSTAMPGGWDPNV